MYSIYITTNPSNLNVSLTYDQESNTIDCYYTGETDALHSILNFNSSVDDWNTLFKSVKILNKEIQALIKKAEEFNAS